jgi:hypothetical protein
MSNTTNDVTEELVLAAMDRAARHRAREKDEVPVWALFEHLAIPRRSGAARRVRARVDAMEVAGLVERSRRHSVGMLVITRRARRLIKQLQQEGSLPVLPESPQHQKWRHARTLAGQEIERFRARVRGLIGQVLGMLDASPAVDSDAWFDVAEQLHIACRRLGSATYCLHEWQEPDDAHADLEDHGEISVLARARRAGRRNVRLWDTTAR